MKKLRTPRTLNGLLRSRAPFGRQSRLKPPPVPTKVSIIRKAEVGLMPLLSLLPTRSNPFPRWQVPLIPEEASQEVLTGQFTYRLPY